MRELKNTLLQKPYNVLVIGDDCLDVYQFGSIDRLSPEAPVPVFKYGDKESRPGMAANVVKNLENFGCNVKYLHGETSVKTRLIDVKSKQHIVRLDNDTFSNPLQMADIGFLNYDALVISDYNKGTVDYKLIEELENSFKGPIFIDTKKTDLDKIKKSFVKINALEESLLKTKSNYLIITLGDSGAKFNEILYPAPKVEVVDVCGAGDTFLAALTFEFLRTRSIEDSIKFANKASAITVQHTGVYAPTLEEIK
jgi:D-beta-D-heptose 7-phosphate kinase/D-beta-D-heptose 1-phosphate adenosyltransferase